MRTPSMRVTAALAAGMLAIGVAVGAAIGPSPTSSFAGEPIQRLLPSIAALALAGAGHSGSSSTPAKAAQAQPPTSSAEPTPAPAVTPRRHRRRHHKKASVIATAPASAETTAPQSSSSTPASGSSPTDTGTTQGKKKLPSVSKVWLIELAGSSFTEAASQTAAASYIDTQATAQGTLLSSWSALQGGTFAGDAALIAGSSPQLLDAIVQPPCPEGAAGATCQAGTPGALTAASEFLKATLPTITSTSAYKESGLVVVTFASIANATATGLPAGATTSTLTSKPPAGVLLISPYVAAGAKSQATFDPASPTQSLEQLLRR
jgi:hypothetical protein